MKANISFNLDDFDDKKNHMIAVKSMDILLALDDVVNLICKEANTCEEKDYVLLDRIRKEMFDKISEREEGILELLY